MAVLHQIRVTWAGAPGMPGVSTFYTTTSPATLLPKIRTFFEAIKGMIPNTVTISYPSAGNDIDDSTGNAVAGWIATAPANTVCSNTNPYSAASGAVVNWKTAQYLAGRQLRGKTFIVPLNSQSFGTDGRLTALDQTAIQTAASNLCATVGDLYVYSSAHHTSAAVTTASVPRLGAVLRSRRD